MITGLYAAILTFIYLGLTIHTIRGRWKHKIGLLDGGNNDMTRRMRMHGHFAEFVPLLLIIMFLIEQNGWPDWLLHSYGIVLVISRVLHPWGLHLSDQYSPQRFYANALGQFLMVTGAGLLIWSYVF